ncbi:MAG: hypothetical protein WBA22_16140 [Candidatus Methanofastidiosia archaeon]
MKLEKAPREVDKAKEDIEKMKEEMMALQENMLRNMISIFAIFVAIFSFLLVSVNTAVSIQPREVPEITIILLLTAVVLLVFLWAAKSWFSKSI